MAAKVSAWEPATSSGGVSTDELRTRIREWLRAAGSTLGACDDPAPDFDVRAEQLRRLQSELFEAGWLRYGWPVELGGLGGDARHRAVVYDELGRAGVVLRGPVEHLEIMAAPLVRHWSKLDASTFTAFLRGDEWWCQGFSEPDAGSDLVALQTRAVREGEVYRLTGRKLWTSWAAHATRCLVLARTGSREARHRGLSVFFVDLASQGVEVRPVRQANGSDELAEITFDDVVVPADRLVGDEGSGFAVALDVLGCERSSFAWLRQAVLYARADDLAGRVGDAHDRQFGESLVDLFALRSAAAEQVHRLPAEGFPGPEAAVVKVLLTRAEQSLYDTAYSVLGSAMPLGSTPDMANWQEEYLFSRAVSIYGGTKQVQLTTVARFLLELPTQP